MGRYDHTAVWLNGLVYVGGGDEAGWEESFTINCYDPLKNLWSSSIKTPYCRFAMTELNNKLLIAGRRDKSYKVTNQILTMDNGQLKNYTKMTIARSTAAAAGHQGMLIIAGVWMVRVRDYPLLNYLTVPIDNGTHVVIYLNHTTG